METTNSIVRKALNAVARNFTPTSEFEIGDKVRFRDSVRSVPHDETYTVVKVSGKNITIKGGRDNGTSTEFANNLEIVENAATSTVSEKAVNAEFYATGYTNGGANEKQIGPFKTKEEAIKAGREEQGASGTFRFAGVVSEDGAYVYHNARARNAEFNVGDRVRIKNPNRQIGQDDGIYEVTLIRPDGMISVKAPSEKVGFAVRPEQLIANSRARNAKFKAGDKAYVHWFSGEDELVDVISYEPKGDYYIVRGEDGQLAHPKSYLLYPVKNASALNAVRVGMKDTNGRDISIGDSIQHIDSKMKGKVVGKFNEHLLLVDWDGGFQEEVHPSDIRITNSRACNAVVLQPDYIRNVVWKYDLVASMTREGPTKDDRFSTYLLYYYPSDRNYDKETKTPQAIHRLKEKIKAVAQELMPKIKSRGAESVKLHLFNGGTSAGISWLKRCRDQSSNAIVRKAMNAVAKNYGTNPFKEGGRVKWRYRNPMRDDYAGWNTDIVDKVNGDYIHIKGLVDDIPWKGNEAIEVSRNSSVSTALNYSPYKKGAWLHDDKGREYIVVEEEHWGKNGGAERFVTIRDEQTKQTKEVAVTELDNRFNFGEAKNAAMAQNAVAMNWNYKNSYQFFCVDPSLKAPCILSGWDYREDAKDDAAELKEAGIPHKIVSRRFLVQQGIDPNAESSWKKNRQ